MFCYRLGDVPSSCYIHSVSFAVDAFLILGILGEGLNGRLSENNYLFLKRPLNETPSCCISIQTTITFNVYYWCARLDWNLHHVCTCTDNANAITVVSGQQWLTVVINCFRDVKMWKIYVLKLRKYGYPK